MDISFAAPASVEAGSWVVAGVEGGFPGRGAALC